MNKSKNSILCIFNILIFTVVIITSLLSCDFTTEKEKRTYTITFESQGGNDVSSQTGEHGTLVNEPEPPKKTDYYFIGWFKDANCIDAFNFAVDKVIDDCKFAV